MGVNESERDHAVNLEKVDHVVVMMLENRSFDHMLGYLSLTGRRPDIDGLRSGFANEYQGRTYPVHHLGTTALDVDPDHSADAVDEQVAGGSMGGFVANAAATLAGRGVEDGDPACVMGYYDGADVPVYDHLAEEFAVCHRWFSSVPGATLPNRLYALCGVAAGSRDDRPSHVPPLYHQPSFVRHLDAHHDHTSIIKTILLRFCPNALHEPQQEGKTKPRLGLGPQYPGMRVVHANHLGELLTRITPRPAPPRDALLRQAAARAAQAKISQPQGPGSHPPNDLQKSVLAATHELTRRGHPPNAP